jgi:outer membrane protein assembly factor BamB
VCCNDNSIFSTRPMRGVAIAGLIAAIAACSEPSAPASDVLWYVAGHSGAGRPAVDDSTVYFVAAADSHAVHAFDRATGKPRWTASTGVTGAGTFSENGCMLTGQIVACGDGTDIVGLSISDGHPVWSFRPVTGRFPGAYISTMDSGRTMIYSPSPQNMVHAIDAATGIPKWSVPVISGTSNLVVYKVVDGGDQVYAVFTVFGNPDTGGVVALSKSDGATRWLTTFSLPDTAAGAEELATWSNDVIVSRTDGRIDALDRSSGALAWEVPGVKTYPAWQGPLGPVGFDIRTLLVSANTLTSISVSGWVVSYDLPTHAEIARATASGATNDRAGRFAQAKRGTIFLDEIGDTPTDFQAKLLRVLQEREYYPVGADLPERAEARVITATHRNLERLVQSGGFREDLYYRLRVVEIEIPPLRERTSDIPLLADRLLAKAAAAHGRPAPALSRERTRELPYAGCRIVAKRSDTPGAPGNRSTCGYLRRDATWIARANGARACDTRAQGIGLAERARRADTRGVAAAPCAPHREVRHLRFASR